MGSIYWCSPAGSENMTRWCGRRSVAVFRGLVSASTPHETNRWKIPSAVQRRVVLSARFPRKKTHKSPLIPGDLPRVFLNSNRASDTLVLRNSLMTEINPGGMQHFWTLTPDALCAELRCGRDGLYTQDAEARLRQ